MEFVFDAVLVAFAFDFERRQDEAVAHEVRSVPDTFARLETETKSQHWTGLK